MEVAILLHNVRSAHNVGSIFRTADAAGVSHLYLTGYSPCPHDRYGRAQKEIAKTALGAEKHLPWTFNKNAFAVVRRLKNSGWRVVGVEQDVRAKNYRAHASKQKTLYIFGNEVRGLSLALRNVCHELIEIPVRGALLKQKRHPHHTGHGKESLNVSVAAGIILFRVCSKFRGTRVRKSIFVSERRGGDRSVTELR